MTAYEIISIFIGILALLIAFGGFVIALLAFLDKRNRYNRAGENSSLLVARPVCRFGGIIPLHGSAHKNNASPV